MLEDSSISIGAKAKLDNGVIQGVIGPLSIALGNPTAGAPATEKAQVGADLSIALAKSGAAADTPVSFSDFIGAVGVTPKDGRLLWRYPWKTQFNLNIATPIYADGKVFISSNYGTGGALFRLT